MKIILLTQYFFPETGATSNRLFSLACYLQQQGHEVTVIAEKPNHPAGVFFPGYERGFVLQREYQGIPVIYTWVYTRPEKGFIGRILFYTTFMVSSVIGSLFFRGGCDVVLASSPPLFVGPAGWMIAKLKRARYIFDVRDLWPQVAVAMGELNNPRAIRVAESIERFTYRKADVITTVTHSFAREIRTIVGDETPIELVMNGALTTMIDSIDRDAVIRQLHDPDRFTVTYAGNLGLAQGLAHICEAARIMKETDPEVRFLLIGDGPKREEIEELIARYHLTNVERINRVPLEEALHYLIASDALLVPLANDEIYRMFIPSKLFDSMAAGRPALLSVDGESRRILETADAGVYYEAEDGAALAEAIRTLKSDRQACERMGRNGYDAARAGYTREQQWKIMEQVMRDLVSPDDATSKHQSESQGA